MVAPWSARGEGWTQAGPGRECDYLRNLLVAVGILETWEPHIERFTGWLATEVLPALRRAQADVIRQYARWHVLRNLRIQTATQAHLEHFLARPGYNRTAAIAGFPATLVSAVCSPCCSLSHWSSSANAAAWARLAARDWGAYIQHRAAGR